MVSKEWLGQCEKEHLEAAVMNWPRCIVLITAISGVVASYGIYAYTHPSINGIALSAVIGTIALMVGVTYKELKDLKERLSK